MEDFRLGVELARSNPSDAQSMAPALIRSAWGRFQVGQTAEAQAEFREALTHLQRDPYARPWTMAEVAFDVGEAAGAREILEGLPPSPGRDAMIALAFNGEPLRPANGYPARLLLPGYEGNANIKWLRRIELANVLARHPQSVIPVCRVLAREHRLGAWVAGLP